MLRSTSGARRATLILFGLLLALVFVLPHQGQALLQRLGHPLAWVVAYPVNVLADLNRSLAEAWDGYIALHRVHEENRRLRQEIAALQGQLGELRETAAAARRLASLLEFKTFVAPRTVAAQVVGRDSTNWFRGLVLNKGERDGVRVEMGVITQAGAVGRIVKTTPSTAVVLLINDPNNAVTGLIQRTRDEGIVEGTPAKRARMKYIPLLSTVREGDLVVTSGLGGVFPKGLPIGTVARIEKAEGELFQSAELVPAVEFAKLEEVLVVTSVFPAEGGGEPAGSPTAADRGERP